MKKKIAAKTKRRSGRQPKTCCVVDCTKWKGVLAAWFFLALLFVMNTIHDIHYFHHNVVLEERLPGGMESLSSTHSRRQAPVTAQNSTTPTIIIDKKGMLHTKNATLPKNIPAKDYADPMKYWRYDEAAPPIRHAKTHELKSLPLENKMGPLAFENLTHYLRQPQNQYPQKLHVFETNPSITILPRRYQVPFGNGNDDMPLYLASYRLTHKHNCAGNMKSLMYGGGDWKAVKKVPKTDYLGLALLREDLTIVADVVVLLNNTKLKKRGFFYSDFRLYTIHDKLYLSTSTFIAQLQLSDGQQSSVDKFESNYIKLEHLDKTRHFYVYLDATISCPPEYKTDHGSKNLLYFVNDNNQTMTEFWPSTPNNQVRPIDLTQKCPNKAQPAPKDAKNTGNIETALPSFSNFHEQRYSQTKDLLLGDRGSACCVRMKNPWTGKEYLVGASHPKTPFPGKKLPKGVVPNTYLSRFFAMEAVSPYIIVARTGAFCLGYSQQEEVQDTWLWSERNNPITMSEDTFDCPRIHFVMSMIENVINASQVILSYGVSDCMSRFVTIDKVDIQAMLWPNNSAKK